MSLLFSFNTFLKQCILPTKIQKHIGYDEMNLHYWKFDITPVWFEVGLLSMQSMHL
jgi:hypothetical protein